MRDNRKQLIEVDASRIYSGAPLYVDADGEIWQYYSRRHTSRVPLANVDCVVCGDPITPTQNWYEKVSKKSCVLHEEGINSSGCVEALGPGEILDAYNKAEESADETMLDLEDDEDMSHPDITWHTRPLVLIPEHEQNHPGKFAVDMHGRKWQQVPFNKHLLRSASTCEICGKELVNNEGVWIKRVNDYLNQICDICVVIVERADVLDAYLEKHNIPKRCMDFDTCSQHCEVVKDYHVRSGDLIYRDYRCLVCDRTWFATYRPEVEVDSDTEEVYKDHT